MPPDGRFECVTIDTVLRRPRAMPDTRGQIAEYGSISDQIRLIRKLPVCRKWRKIGANQLAAPSITSYSLIDIRHFKYLHIWHGACLGKQSRIWGFEAAPRSESCPLAPSGISLPRDGVFLFRLTASGARLTGKNRNTLAAHRPRATSHEPLAESRSFLDFSIAIPPPFGYHEDHFSLAAGP